ncbi:alpha/beta hydrolase, partial [Streptomyces sp. NPDC006324]
DQEEVRHQEDHRRHEERPHHVPQLRAAGLVTAGARDALVGPARPAAAVSSVRRELRSFFARHLS